ncbi:hypothetical protein FKW77_007884 [Venturia effusa]|uniref:Uncharacterized protein n=1 Tax=Venturia effusa TaxID=50376 RepID=A0A517LLW3_9PEZI|nr:hypothetical protein FKW77_007884 [Venturia effusa]
MVQENVRLGLWTDHTTNRQQILATDFAANVMKTLVAVALALSAKYITQILRHWGLRYLRWKDRQSSSQRIGRQRPRTSLERGSRAPNIDEAAPDLTPSHLNCENNRQTNPLVVSEMSKGGLRKLFHKMFTGRSSISQLAVLVIPLSGAWVGLIIGGHYSATVATNRTALLKSEKCGIWMFDDENAGQNAASWADLNDRQKEARAADYARRCYGDSQPGEPTQCDFFYTRNITYSEPFYSYKCPFPSNDVSAPATQSVTFDTGLVHASVLGINSDKTHKFRRKTTCSSLRLDGPFMTKIVQHGSTTYFYHFGHVMGNRHEPLSNVTYSTTGDPFTWEFPGYKLATYTTSLFPELDYWHPIAEIAPPENSTLAVIFVNSLRVTYPRPSFDQFQATYLFQRPFES